MEKPYFIMINIKNKESAMPYMRYDQDGGPSEVIFFETKEEAIETANLTSYCTLFGYKIFSMNGCE